MVSELYFNQKMKKKKERRKKGNKGSKERKEPLSTSEQEGQRAEVLYQSPQKKLRPLQKGL